MVFEAVLWIAYSNQQLENESCFQIEWTKSLSFGI
jgi:hypothetical protein